MNQQGALFTFNLFKKLASTCFKQAYCSSSGDTTLYIQQLVLSCVYVDWLLAGSEWNCQLPVNIMHDIYQLLYIQSFTS